MSLDDVITIDCLYRRPRHAAAFLMVENGEAAFVETNTVHAVPLLLAALKETGIAPEQVRHVIVTHIHFDHAGGASVLLDHCPNAAVICHPRAQRHLVDPARLIEGAKRVYGAEEFERLYMPMHAIAEDRVRGMDDGARLVFGGRTFTFVHTRGHANHHMVIHDSKTGGVFTGDAFGVEYDAGRRSERPFLLCSSAPTDFDPDEALASVDKVLALRPSRLHLTHYGELADAAAAALVLKESITRLVAVAKAAAELSLHGRELHEFCVAGARRAARELADGCSVILTDADHAALESHIEVSAQGLAVYAEKAMAGTTA
jgi:glyoxylase-like metal-dependent hydrolase (beta-lactamase superfamily II)